ncbi:MAG: glycerate kinase family protein [Gammaproteobacteria bacterium]
MKIVIATDSFKENLSSLQAGQAIQAGIRRVLPKARCVIVPMADGGEGTVQSIIDAAGGKLIRLKVSGPLAGKVTARYGFVSTTKTAIIEMAEASGLALIRKKDPLRASSYGTGELMRDALRRGARRIILGLGGSATNDGGIGMAQALGVRFRDADGRLLRQKGCGRLLTAIDSIDMSEVHPQLAKTRVTVACDVDNPLYGKRGAAYVFGPQKGATAAMVKQLDQGLRNLARVIKRDLGLDVATVAGAGAAGGLGAGLLAFADATLESGVDIVMRATQLKKHIRNADLIITGEGRIDSQTAHGKTPAGVARLAAEFDVPVIAIGGSLADDAGLVFAHGIGGIEAAVARDMSLQQALADAAQNISNAAERVMRLLVIGKQLR